MLQPSLELTAMIAAAQAAGSGLKRHFAQLSGLGIRAKSGPADLVSIADEEAEATVRGLLAVAQPGYGFLGEEGGVRAGSDAHNTWIVDPLDGTTNFLFGAPLWGVNIALAREGRVVAAVTYLPMLDEMYVAEAGQGSWLNGQRIHVSGRATLVEAVLGCGIPFAGKPAQARFAREMALLTPRCAGIRRTGACAVDMAWVAAGRWDAYWENALCAWDMAPGTLLVQEAGGIATAADGSVLDPFGTSVLVSNGVVHAPLLEFLDQAREEPA
ncbi:inositol monophosphatase family protein [Luteimonas sp. 8-5]|jgi:myo-inositol-1(or 4)-monophosphatase|uniref:inositol monophosphatase family protein n=1 Tax=Luteimonas sp. 8-5 TaxID=3039387 RepID=UPI0024365A8B|nr:inositol monophosphatase family protein [Luteimonas sp. 8-5]MDG6348724.1 inositol monophosphatase family protein [Luteimonas sp. 8-5]